MHSFGSIGYLQNQTICDMIRTDVRWFGNPNLILKNQASERMLGRQSDKSGTNDTDCRRQ